LPAFKIKLRNLHLVIEIFLKSKSFALEPVTRGLFTIENNQAYTMVP
jgi:hypothetical protein